MIRLGTIEEVVKLLQEIPEFEDPYDAYEFEKRLGQSQSLIIVAEQDGNPVAFKCGYQRGDQETFYSWMGGVLPHQRRKGLAEALLRKMEEWCLENEYKKLSFKTLNEHKSMLIFAIKNGFEISHTTDSSKDRRKRIWLHKQLDHVIRKI